MRLHLTILTLPTSVLLLLASQTNLAEAADGNRISAQWPRDLVALARDWIHSSTTTSTNNNEEVKRATGENTRSPVGIMKMSVDEGEKFFREYWQYGDDAQSSALGERDRSSIRPRDLKEDIRLLANVSTLMSFRAPFALHTENQYGQQGDQYLRARERGSAAALAILEKRDFKCPTGTSSCSSVGYPNSCCASDETCFQIVDTGLGPVGCCPSGGNCGGSITSCASPNTPCADNIGGGCCIPDYVCASVGCVLNSSLVVVVTTTRTITAGLSTTIQTTTMTSTRSTSSSSSSISSTVSRTSTAVTTTTTTSASGVVPVRPTGDSTGTITGSSTTTTTGSDTCPTGFYACSAYYQGGCCRTGRNCDTTSCPATSSTTLISSGQTIVVPVGTAASLNTPTGTCATGWTTCPASVGGDCCPSGYACGTASCSSAEASATQVLQKEVPGIGKRLEIGGIWGLIGLIVGLII